MELDEIDSVEARLLTRRILTVAMVANAAFDSKIQEETRMDFVKSTWSTDDSGRRHAEMHDASEYAEEVVEDG